MHQQATSSSRRCTSEEARHFCFCLGNMASLFTSCRIVRVRSTSARMRTSRGTEEGRNFLRCLPSFLYGSGLGPLTFAFEESVQEKNKVASMDGCPLGFSNIAHHVQLFDDQKSCVCSQEYVSYLPLQLFHDHTSCVSSEDVFAWFQLQIRHMFHKVVRCPQRVSSFTFHMSVKHFCLLPPNESPRSPSICR